MKPVGPKDNVLVYALANYLDLGAAAPGANGRGGRAPMIASSVLLALHRAKGVLHKERLIQASYCTPGCRDNNFRMILWSAREGLGGEEFIEKEGDFYKLSPSGRVIMDNALREIRRQFELSLNASNLTPEKVPTLVFEKAQP